MLEYTRAGEGGNLACGHHGPLDVWEIQAIEKVDDLGELATEVIDRFAEDNVEWPALAGTALDERADQQTAADGCAL